MKDGYTTPQPMTFTTGYNCASCGVFVPYWQDHNCQAVQVQSQPTVTITYPRIADLERRVAELERKLASK